MIKAIETQYNGYKFRSRLEARWAVFFDKMNIEWQYEAEGYEIAHEGKNWYYLPDFYLPKIGCHVEVKGSLDHLPPDYFHMIACAVDQLPNGKESFFSSKGLLWLGDIPHYTMGKNDYRVLDKDTEKTGGF